MLPSMIARELQRARADALRAEAVRDGRSRRARRARATGAGPGEAGRVLWTSGQGQGQGLRGAAVEVR